MSPDQLTHHVKLSDRTLSELRQIAEQLGETIPHGVNREDLERIVRQRLDFVHAIDRGALLDLAAWAGVELEDNPSNELLVRRVLRNDRNRLDKLSVRGLRALARLRNLEIPEDCTRQELERLLRKPERFWDTVRRRRRQIIGSILSRALETKQEEKETSSGPQPRRSDEPSLKERIQGQGVVSGLAQTLRGVADDYVAEKLDEIERRIDAKLDDIDHRLGEWRDREITHRLRILKITLIFSILVALVSLGYDYLQRGVNGEPPPPTAVRGVDE